MTITFHEGDCRELLRTLPEKHFHTCVTSPPYFGLRDYGVDGQIGLEATPDEFVSEMVAVFREVRRVLRDDGTVWLNLGDSYNGYMANQRGTGLESKRQQSRKYIDPGAGLRFSGLKQKDLIGIPWRVAFALQADGWYLRQDIIWAKPNPMPESVRDRCTKSHEYIFLLSKRPRYFYDQEAIAEASKYPPGSREDVPQGGFVGKGADPKGQLAFCAIRETRNRRSVWTIATQPYSEAHFATFPPKLIEPCILAGCPVGGNVLDPFGGTGTTGLVADRHQRNATLIELNPEYAEMGRRRIESDAGMFAEMR